jgi:FkbM family methyltransferase
MTIASAMADVARKFGVDVRRFNAYTSPFLRLAAELERRSVKVVLDVGANDGGFASDLLEAGYTGRIISFEPLPEAWARLQTRTRAHAGRWTVGPRVAISDTHGSATFHEAGNSVSSSLLAMAKLHENASPGSSVVRTIEVDTRTIDELLEPLRVPADAATMLKIDVQGAERMVLAGAREALQRQIQGVKLEMSLAELYADQPLWMEHHNALQAMGFNLWDIEPGFRDATSKRLLQFDGVYFRD